MEPRIIWLGHASFKILSESKTIYIDPWKTKNQPKADLILVTHSHFDHLSEDDIASLKKVGTVIMGPKDVGEKLPGTSVIGAGEKKDVDGIRVEAYPAYNPKKEFHPKENGWLGFVVDIGGFRIYHSGDTDIIEEMSQIDNIDVALLPVGGTYTMTPEEAAEAVKKLSPKKAIPMHWGDIIGGKEDALKFKDLAGCDVELQEPQS